VLHLLLAASAVAAPLARPEVDSVPTRIANVRILEPGVVTGPWDVWLADGAIVHRAPAGEDFALAVERTVDGTGCTLMAGLVDLHVHVGSTTAVPGRIHVPSPRDNLDALLYAGVTTIFEPSSPLEDVAKWQARIDDGRWAGPAIVGTGRPFGAPEGHPRASLLAMFPSFLVEMTTHGLAWEVADGAACGSAPPPRARGSPRTWGARRT
jgi:hypothetical protein